MKDPDGGTLSVEQDQMINDLFENDYFIIRPVDIPIARISRRISREFGVKPKDAIHLATAIFWNVPVFHTYEDKLLNKNGKIGDPPLKIEPPSWAGQQNLVFSNKQQAKSDSEN